MKIAIVGAGYVGLVTGACLADKGHAVWCVDVDADRVRQINAGRAPFFEPGLDGLLCKHVGERLLATDDPRRAVEAADVSIIAVGTPFDGQRIDLSQVRAAAEQIGDALKGARSYHVVVVKSTVVPGTTDGVVLPALEKASGRRAGAGFGVGVNPEFLRQGHAVQDFMEPDRIVIGGLDARTLETLDAVYRSFGEVQVVRTTNRTAEMIKYVSNALLATLISFSNEVADMCAALGGIDVRDVMRAVHLDRRFSPKVDGRRIVPAVTAYLEAGCGFGGSCLPKDLKALMAHGRAAGVHTRLLEAVLAINEDRPRQILRMLSRHFPSLRGVQVSVLGLAFKPGTDDVRDSPALPVIRLLQQCGAVVRVYDPVAEPAGKEWRDQGAKRGSSLAEAIKDCEAIVVLTAWEEFNRLPQLVADLPPPGPVVVDGRRMFEKSQFRRYEGIGWSVDGTAGGLTGAAAEHAG
ncbi:MAG: UDP-glucose/GDP-mannose dehydrogenase family protein [Armatimonadota bacterium]|nr:UDP-glucose/GDP-mannose dehydrogenase family protein [Armatimonadota bacterium]